MLDKKTVSQCVSADYCRGWNDAVDEMPRWISVEERLPEDDADVLVYAVSNDDKSRDSCIAMTSYTHNMHGFNIEGWRPPWQYFSYNYMITHWMPLPPAPKEESTC